MAQDLDGEPVVAAAGGPVATSTVATNSPSRPARGEHGGDVDYAAFGPDGRLVVTQSRHFGALNGS